MSNFSAVNPRSRRVFFDRGYSSEGSKPDRRQASKDRGELISR